MPDTLSHENNTFAGYRWSYFSSLSKEPLKARAQAFLQSINWDLLTQCASTKRNGLECRILPDIGLGYNHMVRIVEFSDRAREYWTICLVRRESTIPVPRVHLFETDTNSSVGAQFMLMDCLQGNAGRDLSMNIPPEHKLDVYARMAEIHIDMFNIRLPKIGKVTGINADGTYQQGPLPILGGPFNTAAEFFIA
ncbi:hypothetical protein P168DRAFT_9365 [Aspergillus campestris IBT 28561]|uniref:Aminoglycoside phosphotransferase domain-containing protein n=1 Tax=Aspergillus campestris (strain IBT 28561) TaxID=1392248 RepID=A0A2I1DE44_ASPC2|nr:uncharacterized protein P168DRAFT_9365 [Aspergillus campestris IBT 28561]PKY08131.1 hypothetical protein P168DRAFT_9365 [Aspergillus campestris IBT 28561]